MSGGYEIGFAASGSSGANAGSGGRFSHNVYGKTPAEGITGIIVFGVVAMVAFIAWLVLRR